MEMDCMPIPAQKKQHTKMPKLRASTTLTARVSEREREKKKLPATDHSVDLSLNIV